MQQRPNVSTATIYVGLNGGVDFISAAPVLDIFHLGTTPDCPLAKLPTPDALGEIISIVHRGGTRGVVKKTTNGKWPNGNTLRIVTSHGLATLNLSNNSVNCTGMSCMSMAVEAVELLIERFWEAQRMLEHMRANPKLAAATANWVIEHTKGESHLVIPGTRWHACEGEEWEEIYSVVIPPEYPASYPPGVDPAMANFMINKAPDYYRHDYLAVTIEYLLSCRDIISEGTGIQQVQTSMVNYTYRLPVVPSLSQLHTAFGRYSQFTSTYNPDLNDELKLTLPFQLTSNIRRTGNKRNDHSWRIKGSGFTTQSSPSFELGEAVYQQFVQVVSKILAIATD